MQSSITTVVDPSKCQPSIRKIKALDVQMLIKAVVNTVGGLMASRRVFCWLPLFFFGSYSTNLD